MNTYEYTYYARSGTMLIRVHLQEYKFTPLSQQYPKYFD